MVIVMEFQIRNRVPCVVNIFVPSVKLTEGLGITFLSFTVLEFQIELSVPSISNTLVPSVMLA